MAKRRLGVWLIGARGGVATTTIVGLHALRRKLVKPYGIASELPRFSHLDLANWDDIIVGGHEIRTSSLYDEAMKLVQVSRALDGDIVNKVKADLAKVDQRIKPGILFNVGPTIESLADADLVKKRETPRDGITRIQNDLKEFAASQKLDNVIMLNVASTEPPVPLDSLPKSWKELAKLIEKPKNCPLGASSLYAVAALELGFPFVNFTPSMGSAPPAINELAVEKETCHMGHDGKTGETLIKSALAPMFANRNLEIMSWVGHNIFGNMDGQVLNDPANKATKVKSKDRLLGEILGYNPQTHISIEYIQSLGDWKTAWDHIHFRGFLGTPMIMQYIWQGCDSILAAPLVLDLIRFTDLSYRKGDRGLLSHLACFFKSPIGVAENDFVRQFQMLERWAGCAETPAE